jgi:hypothetical protein
MKSMPPGAVRFHDKAAKCPFVHGARSSSACSCGLASTASHCTRGLRFSDRRRLSGALRGVPREALCAAVARKPRWPRRARRSRPLRRPRAHSDTDPGPKGEPFRGLHAGGVGVVSRKLDRVLQGRSESEQFDSLRGPVCSLSVLSHRPLIAMAVRPGRHFAISAQRLPRR